MRTDHEPVTWLYRSPQPIGQQARWLDLLAEYDMEIQHRPGRRHNNADALSRIPYNCQQCGRDESGYISKGDVTSDNLACRNVGKARTG